MADLYRGIVSDISETWVTQHEVKNDLTKYLISLQDAAGDELYAETVASILDAITEANKAINN